MGWQLCFSAHFAGDGGNDDCGAVFIPHVILNDNNGAISFLLGADAPPQVGIIQIAALVCPVHVFDLPYKFRRCKTAYVGDQAAKRGRLGESYSA